MSGPYELINSLVSALGSLDRLKVKMILTRAGEVYSSVQIIEKVVAPAMERIGDDWSRGNISLSQVYMSGRICEEFVYPMASFPGGIAKKNQPRIAIAVLLDHHSLGKKIVCSFLRAAGFEVADYGEGLTVDNLVERTIGDNIEVLMISTLMLPSALRVKEVRLKLAERGCKARVVVGGAPFLFDRELWKDVGADALGRNASEAIEIVDRMMGGTK
jgi:trimethylamine corrinoid protein